MKNVVKRLLLMQVIAAVIVAVLAVVSYGGNAAISALYGGLIAWVMTAMLAWRVHKASQSTTAVRWLMLGAVERIIVVCILFAVGIGLLELWAPAILVGFGASELAYYLAAGPLRRQMLKLMGRQYDGQ